MADQRLAEFLRRIPANAPARVPVDIQTAFGIVATAREKISAFAVTISYRAKDRMPR